MYSKTIGNVVAQVIFDRPAALIEHVMFSKRQGTYCLNIQFKSKKG